MSTLLVRDRHGVTAWTDQRRVVEVSARPAHEFAVQVRLHYPPLLDLSVPEARALIAALTEACDLAETSQP